MFRNNLEAVTGEIRQVLSQVNEEEVKKLVSALPKARRIVAVGAGRVGMAARAFTMRLGHLGMGAYFLGDTTVPHIGEGDLLLACSGSGETQTVYDIVEIAKKNGAKVALVTGNRDSRMGKIADLILEIKAPTKTRPIEGFASIQPMTTLNEQCLHVAFDVLVLELMSELSETHDTMWSRHSNLE